MPAPPLPPPGDPPPAGRRLCRPGSTPAPPSTGPQGPQPPPHPVPPSPRAAAVLLGRVEGGGVSWGPSAPSPGLVPSAGSGSFLVEVPAGGAPQGLRGAAAGSCAPLSVAFSHSLSFFLSLSLSPRGTWASAPAPARHHSLQCGLGVGAQWRRSADPPRRPGDRRAIGARGSRGRAATTAAGTRGPRVTSPAPSPAPEGALAQVGTLGIRESVPPS